MKKYLQKIVCLSVLSCIVLTGCSRQPEVHSSVDTAMGTIISQTVYISPEAGISFDREELSQPVGQITDEILASIVSLEKEVLSWRLDTSEIYRINANAGNGQAMALSDKLFSVLEQCNEVYLASGGAFDITIGNLARLWDIDTWASGQQVILGQNVQSAESASERNVSEGNASEDKKEGFVPPTTEAIEKAMLNSGADKLSLEGQCITVPAGMQLDLGAVGKGIVLDAVQDILAKHSEVTGAVISAGGSILTYGCKPNGSSWNVAIVDPFDTTRNIGILKLNGQWCVSTSGDYERFVEVDGKRYHHILDPATGYPADSGVKSVTILTDSGLYSDALSTACFVLGVEDGLRLAESFRAEALFVDTEGEIYMTEGMSAYFQKAK